MWFPQIRSTLCIHTRRLMPPRTSFRQGRDHTPLSHVAHPSYCATHFDCICITLFLEFKFSNISSPGTPVPGTLLPLVPVVDICSSLFIPVYVSEKFSPVITFCEELMPFVERDVVVLIPEIELDCVINSSWKCDIIGIRMRDSGG